MLRHRILAPAAVAAAVVGLAACGSSSATSTTTAVPATSPGSSVPAGAVTDVTPQQAAALIESQPGLVVVDVRTPAEFDSGHLPGAQNIDVSAAGFTQAVSALDRSAPTLVYCRTGNRSAGAVATMASLGFTDIRHMTDGIVAWDAAGLPVAAPGSTVYAGS